MNTHESYVSLETAKMLKKAGFDWETRTAYRLKDAKFADKCNNYIFWNDTDAFCSAPTLDVAQRWLREMKGLHICVKAGAASINCKYFVTVIVSDTKWGNIQDNNRKTIMFDTYEEAQEAGIKKELEMILEKGE